MKTQPKKTRELAIYAFALTAGAVTILGLSPLRQLVFEGHYILENLDPEALHISSFKRHSETRAFLKYDDLDSDGDFDSYILWINSDGTTISIPVKRNVLTLQSSYGNIKPGTIEPLHAAEHGLPIDYFTNDAGLVEARAR